MGTDFHPILQGLWAGYPHPFLHLPGPFCRYTLIPTSILLGLGAAPLWSAQCTYLTIMGSAEAQKTGKLSKDVVTQCFGIFFLIFQSSGVWGNLISSMVFGKTHIQGKGGGSVSGGSAALLRLAYLAFLWN